MLERTTSMSALAALVFLSCSRPEAPPPGNVPDGSAAATTEAVTTHPYRSDEPLAEPRRFAPGVVSTDGFELGITFTPDGRTVLFSQIGDGFATSRIVSSTYADGRWGTPQPVSFSGPYRDLDPFVSPDGTRLFFQSDRPTVGSEAKDWDIWVSEATGSGWGPPRNLGPPINTPSTETFPVVVASGALYFSSDRPGSNGGDVYRASASDGVFGDPVALPAPLNTPEFDSNAYVSPDERYLILASARGGEHRGEGDLYLSIHRQGGWTEPEHLGDINTPAREFAPSVSPDGRYLFFTSNRPGLEGSESRLGDIYQVDLPAGIRDR